MPSGSTHPHLPTVTDGQACRNMPAHSGNYSLEEATRRAEASATALLDYAADPTLQHPGTLMRDGHTPHVCCPLVPSPAARGGVHPDSNSVGVALATFAHCSQTRATPRCTGQLAADYLR